MKLFKYFFLFIFALLVIIVARWYAAGSVVEEIAVETKTVDPVVKLENIITSSQVSTIASPIVDLKPVEKLPKIDTPLTQIVDELLLRVKNHDARAACRLGDELLRCNYLVTERKKLISKLRNDLNSQNMSVDSRSKLEEKISAYVAKDKIDSKVCEGFENKQDLDSWRFKFLASLEGHVPSMEEFAMRPSWDPSNINANIDAWRAFVDYREKFLVDAASAGSSSAILTLVEEYSGDSSIMIGPLATMSKIKPDFKKAAMYAYAYTAISKNDSGNNNYTNMSLKKALQKISSEELTQAKKMADSLVATFGDDYFRKREDSLRERSDNVGVKCEL